MLTHAEILNLLGHDEGPLLERKPAKAQADVVRRSVVAFANSVAGTDEAVLFIGVRDKGVIEGCSDTDKVQKMVAEICVGKCYPPIKYRIELLPERQNVVAVIIPASDRRPHFAGPTYVRHGSQSDIASAEMFEELINSRHSLAVKLIEFKRKHTIVHVIGLNHKVGQSSLMSDRNYRESLECKIFDCDAHFVRFRRIDNSALLSEPLSHVSLKYDEEKYRPELVITGY